MSHKATNWAMEQNQLKPAARIVLFCLADRHNPDYGCFPSQKTIAIDANISARSVRDQLELLEISGLIKRVKTIGTSGNFTSDRYMLAFEVGFEVSPAAKSAYGKTQHEPAAKSAYGRRQNLPPIEKTVKDNPVKITSNIEKNTKKENSLETKSAQGGLFETSKTQTTAPKPERFEEFWDTFPHRGGAKKGKGAALKKYTAILKSNVPESEIIEGAKRYAFDRQVLDGYGKGPVPWLNQNCWQDEIEPQRKQNGGTRNANGFNEHEWFTAAMSAQ